MSKKITALTRRDIFNLFINGLDLNLLFGDTQYTTYPYYGLLTEIEFLNRLYNLKDMESYDSRFENAEGDIWQHTVNNEDCEYGWVFSDERFPLKNGSDEELLRFLCEVFHPEVRNEKGYWKEYLDEVNRLLANDDFELYPSHQISNHDVYGWRIKSEAQVAYMPFSLRHKDAIDSKQLKFSIGKNCREQIIKAIQKFDDVCHLTDDTGWNYNSTFSDEALTDLSSYYEPKCYKESDKNEYIKTDNFYEFINGTRPYCVFDAIEVFSNNLTEPEFSKRLNAILSLNGLSYSLKDGKIEANVVVNISDKQIGLAPEMGVKELLQKAQNYYSIGDKQNAVEKLWDAYERLKTIYVSTVCDKKQSISKILSIVSKENADYKDMINSELLALTSIGNKFRIRHHERDKIEINDDRYYDYFYGRCLSSISLILSFVKV